jgi:DNA invertase Pin-like site-specific DNA recombinase
MTTRYPVGYLRRSSADEGNPGDVSREAQEAAIRDLAHRDGHNGDLRLFEDWGRSADEAKLSRRVAFLALLSAIERGEVSAVYAYALDRLYRSSKTFWRLTDAARAHDVRIVTQREGVLGGDGSPMATAFAEITAVFASLELNTVKARNATALAARRARGDVMAAPYGKKLAKVDGRVALVDNPEKPLAPLLDAYTKAGTVLGACKLLDAAGVVRPRHGGVWQPASLSAILARAGVLPSRGHRKHFSSQALLAGLLRCHCGRSLTPDTTTRGYYCANGKRIGSPIHGKTWVSESTLMPFVRDEMAHLDLPDAYTAAESHEAERTALLERRRRLGRAYADGLWTDDDYQAELRAIARALDDLGDVESVVAIPPIDWDAPVADVNEALRAILARIELDANMHPLPPVWRVPGMRRG